jgi:hypothetical protein
MMGFDSDKNLMINQTYSQQFHIGAYNDTNKKEYLIKYELKQKMILKRIIINTPPNFGNFINPFYG